MATDLTIVPTTLTREVVGLLALVAGQPAGAAEVALAAAPYGSRLSLIEHGIIAPVATAGDPAVEIKITPRGRELIEYCASHFDSDQDWALEADARESRRREAPGWLSAEDLDPQLATWLAGLVDEPRDAVCVAISVAPQPWREQLVRAKVITAIASHGDAAVEVQLTEQASGVLQACAGRFA
jgi:hypothetical protein